MQSTDTSTNRLHGVLNKRLPIANSLRRVEVRLLHLEDAFGP
jgi:hypothetical protein